jgi:hypothetical protein
VLGLELGLGLELRLGLGSYNLVKAERKYRILVLRSAFFKLHPLQLDYFLESFKCKSLLLADILRQIVLLPASLQIVHRYCDFRTLNMYMQ